MRWAIIVIEGLYDDYFIEDEKFSLERYTALLQKYEKNREQLKYDELRIRDYVIAFKEGEHGCAVAPGFPGFTVEGGIEWMD